ncbi:MAG: hypothetical protein JXK05_13670 [Campylobacterales bacterium]|nr:hypothetical protein [Campylobacterales bacterium]
MKQCSIDAVYHGEERYSKLSLAFSEESQRLEIEEAIAEATKGFKLEPQIYTSDVSGGRKVLIVEFHDDFDREAGDIFDKILKSLGIECCN